ncbi:MBL fold metallo-hydrolase [Actinoallomurus purpureus]|uniref:MBL fold metallo-hydrolase n=1 Tax=Actinoallomurus purpureus TaxID=478114 RepID=UPI002092759B|nr:MBL fold metallo-hydrolase [Actinoallomurus purpureus]MCO6004802.1 MBL fold metallo-hydrolase [Actinoallomurus purpureus]
MKIHHLNCGSMREIDPADAADHRLEPARALNHCLLVETDDSGLVLVETGFGTPDVDRPEETLGRTFLDRTQALLDPEETAVRQIRRLGHSPDDVRHIVLTHLDLDHSGGLPDFPHATVHLHDAEYRAAMAATGAHPEHALRYRPAHWAHRPHWRTYESRKGESWFGFDALELDGLPPEILLIPLAGHTEGHCAVAVRDEDRWLLHAGDAFYHHGQVEPDDRWSMPLWEALEEITEIDRPLRAANQARLRELLRDHGDEVEVFSAHDPWAFARLAARP